MNWVSVVFLTGAIPAVAIAQSGPKGLTPVGDVRGGGKNGGIPYFTEAYSPPSSLCEGYIDGPSGEKYYTGPADDPSHQAPLMPKYCERPMVDLAEEENPGEISRDKPHWVSIDIGTITRTLGYFTAGQKKCIAQQEKAINDALKKSPAATAELQRRKVFSFKFVVANPLDAEKVPYEMKGPFVPGIWLPATKELSADKTGGFVKVAVDARVKEWSADKEPTNECKISDPAAFIRVLETSAPRKSETVVAPVSAASKSQPVRASQPAR